MARKLGYKRDKLKNFALTNTSFFSSHPDSDSFWDEGSAKLGSFVDSLLSLRMTLIREAL